VKPHQQPDPKRLQQPPKLPPILNSDDVNKLFAPPAEITPHPATGVTLPPPELIVPTLPESPQVVQEHVEETVKHTEQQPQTQVEQKPVSPQRSPEKEPVAIHNKHVKKPKKGNNGLLQPLTMADTFARVSWRFEGRAQVKRHS
jgi:hypothetical protein